MRSRYAFGFFPFHNSVVGFGILATIVFIACSFVAAENRTSWTVPTESLNAAVGIQEDKVDEFGDHPGSNRTNWVTKAYAKNVSAVVSIQGDKIDEFGGGSRSSGDSGKSYNGMGTGIILDERGYIVTNYHVVQGIRKIQVTTYDKSRFIATLEARDPETDLAIIKITPKEPLQTISLGLSDDVMPGEFCMAIGNPFGYPFTITSGLISGISREVAVTDDLLYKNAIQTSTPINPGNSGGPLINVDGEMIGINAAIRQGAESIAFAIPVDQVVDVAAKLIGDITDRSGFHGLRVYQTDSDSEVAKRAGVPQEQGRRSIVVVESVDANSPAAVAGLKSGDVITGIGKFSVENKLDFYRAMLGCGVGDDLGFAVLRERETFDFPLALASPREESVVRSGPKSRSLTPSLVRAGGEPKTVTQVKPSEDTVWETLGLKYSPMPKDEYQRTFAPFLNEFPHGGVVVDSVKEGSALAKTGVVQGDVIVGIHEWVATSNNDLRYIAKVWPTLNPSNGLVQVVLLRKGVSYYVEIPVKGGREQGTGNR